MSRKPYPIPEIDFADYEQALSHKNDDELRAANVVLWIIRRPRLLKTGRLLAQVGLALHVPGTVTALEATVFRQFCGGTSLSEAIRRAHAIYEYGIGTILDYAVEVVEEERDFSMVAAEIERVIDATAEWPAIPLVAVKVSALVRFSLLEKVTANLELSELEQAEFERAENRLVRLAEHASAAGVSLFVDAEHSWIQPAIDTLVGRLMARYNRQRAIILTTVQLYLRDRLAYLKRSIEEARNGGYRLGVKLVRGAYLEQEAERARAKGYQSPVQSSKADTDRDYDLATSLCLDNLDFVTVCVATHNVASTRHMVEDMARLGIERNDPRVFSSQLLGMLDRITLPLAVHGYNVLKYVPYGGVRDALPYLLRRADENKSVADQLAGELDAVRAEMRRRGMRAL